MSVTIHQTPASYTPSDNPIVWTFSSNQTAQPNFVYVVKVYINNVLVKNEMVFPENGIYAKYDASDWASNACNTPTISADLIVNANNYCQVKITVVERYGVTPADQASAAASNIVAFKARMNDDDYINWDPADYIFGTNAKFMTNFPYTTISPKVRAEDEQIRLMLINNGNNVSLAIRLYDAAGGLLASGAYGFTSAAFKILMINATPSVIVAESIGINQSDFEAAAYYTIGDTLDVADFRIDIDTSCVYRTYKRFHFMTQWGSIESYSFGLISRKEAKIESFSYGKRFGQWDGSQFEFSKDQGRDVDYAKIIENKMTVESDFLTEAVQNWLVENMYGSPLVYEQDLTDGTLMRRKVMNTGYKKKIQENDMVFNEVVEIGLPSMTSAIV